MAQNQVPNSQTNQNISSHQTSTSHSIAVVSSSSSLPSTQKSPAYQSPEPRSREERIKMENPILEEVLATMGPMTTAEREAEEKKSDEGFIDLDD